MKPRLELQALLLTLCKNVYFQPPSTVKMKYPCVVYDLESIDTKFADNSPYSLYNRYQLTYISKDPDDINRHEIAKLPLCSMTRTFQKDNLNHYVYRLYF